MPEAGEPLHGEGHARTVQVLSQMEMFALDFNCGGGYMGMYIHLSQWCNSDLCILSSTTHTSLKLISQSKKTT